MGSHCVCLCVSVHACVSVCRIVRDCVCDEYLHVHACVCVCVRARTRDEYLHMHACVCVCDEYLHMHACVCEMVLCKVYCPSWPAGTRCCFKTTAVGIQAKYTPPHIYRHPSASSLFSTFICSPQAQVLVHLYWYLHRIMTTSVIQCLQWTTENQKKKTTDVININNLLCLVFWQFIKVIHKFTHTHILPWYNCNGWLGVKRQVTYTHTCTLTHYCTKSENWWRERTAAQSSVLCWARANRLHFICLVLYFQCLSSYRHSRSSEALWQQAYT